jgi:hypothetical protein
MSSMNVEYYNALPGIKDVVMTSMMDEVKKRVDENRDDLRNDEGYTKAWIGLTAEELATLALKMLEKKLKEDFSDSKYEFSIAGTLKYERSFEWKKIIKLFAEKLKVEAADEDEKETQKIIFKA